MKNVSLPHTGSRLAAAALFVALTGGLPTALVPIEFVDQAPGALPTDGKSHEFTVTYENTTASYLTVAPQLLLVSPDSGPFLKPADVNLELRAPDGRWTTVTPGARTGTLFTDLTTTQHTLAPGETLTRVYRLTVNCLAVAGVVQPRVALYA